MFTNIRSFFAAALLSLAAVATLAAADPQETLAARIPFAFEVGGTTLPAGEYVFSQLGHANVLTISSAENNTRLSALVRSSAAWNATGTGNVVFARSNGKIALRRVLLPHGQWMEFPDNTPLQTAVLSR